MVEEAQVWVSKLNGYKAEKVREMCWPNYYLIGWQRKRRNYRNIIAG